MTEAAVGYVRAGNRAIWAQLPLHFFMITLQGRRLAQARLAIMAIQDGLSLRQHVRRFRFSGTGSGVQGQDEA